ncbi:MAG: energy transducer TonB [Pseudomonadota bacterium]
MPHMASPGEAQNALADWLPALTVVIALHFAAWWGLTHFKAEPSRPNSLPTVQVTLLPPAPAEPRAAPPQPEPPKVIPKQPPKPQPVTAPVSVAPARQTSAVQPEAAPAAPVVSAATAASPAPQEAAEPAVEPPRYHAAYLNNPKPAYPLAARRRGIEGRVLLRVEISPGGECLHAELKKSSGHDMLDQAALEAVRKWRFVPARRGNSAVAAWVEVPIAFKLDE